MHVFPNPENPIWNQTNTTDLFGNLYATRNINLERDGYIGLSKRITSVTATTTTRLGCVTFNGSNYVGSTNSSNSIINISPGSLLSTIDTNTNSNLCDYSTDIIYWNNTIYYTNSTSLRQLISTTYTSVLTLTTSTYTVSGNTFTIKHPICEFTNKVLLAIGDGNIVRTIDESGTLGTILTLPKQYKVDWIKYFGNNLYVGTRNITGGNGVVFVWDGATSSANFGYPYNSMYSQSGIFKNSTLYLLTLKGELLQFTGGGFNKVSQFPFFLYPNNSLTTNFNNEIGSYNMCIIDDEIMISVANKMYDGNNLTGIIENFYSGIWAYHDKYGLYHKYSVGNSKNSSGVIVDYGILYADRPSLIYPLVEPIYSSSIITTPISIGSRLLVSNSYSLPFNCICSITTGENRGYFQTKKIININVNNIQKKLYVKYKNCFDSSDKIIIKYKNENKHYLPFATYTICTWINSNSFSVSSTNQPNFDAVVVGDEVEILVDDLILGDSGTTPGSGLIAHITNITFSSGTYTITIDESVSTMTIGNTFKIKVDNFKKIETIDNTTNSTEESCEIPIDVTSKWISIKVEMRGEGVEIEQMILVDDVNTPSV